MYVVINNEAAWGMGETEEAAIEAAREWVCGSDENGHRVTDVPVVSFHELRRGAGGFAVLRATDAQVRALRDEAARAGDDEQVDVCDAALAGDVGARGECARVIADAAAMAD